MLNKELFFKTLNTIEKHNTLTDEFCTILEKMSPACYCDAFIYNEYEELVLEHLSQHFDIDEMETIKYFIYDLHFGKDYEPGCFSSGGKEIDLSSVEKLYEYLQNCEHTKS